MTKYLLMGLLLFSGCGDKSNNGGAAIPPGKPVPVNRVDFKSIPSEYNPSVTEVEFATDGIERIDVNMLNNENDLDVVYADIPANTGRIRVYKVWKKEATFGDVQTRTRDNGVVIENYGRYACSITVTNSQITALEGGCYLQMQVILPAGARIEVYFVDRLMSQRFFPMSTAVFLQNIRRVFRVEEKFAAIEEFLATYVGMSSAPSLSTEQLQTVFREFFRGEEKLKVLSRLHTAVSDRDKLPALLDREFMFRERDEARRITGL